VQGLVDEAVSLEEPGTAHKPDQRRQVSIKVSTVSIMKNRPERAKQEDDPHGLLTHGPNWTNKQNDPHGLLANRLKSAHKQGTPSGTLTTTKGTQPTHVHDDNPNRATLSKPWAPADHPARALSSECRGVLVGRPHGDHNRYQLRPTMGKTVVSILRLLVLISMIIQGNNMEWNNTRRAQLRPEITKPHGTDTSEGTTYTNGRSGSRYPSIARRLGPGSL
jgi:hypothetical protein